MDFCPPVCGFEQSWMKAVPKRGCSLWRDCPAHAGALLRRVLYPSTKKYQGEEVFVCGEMVAVYNTTRIKSHSFL